VTVSGGSPARAKSVRGGKLAARISSFTIESAGAVTVKRPSSSVVTRCAQATVTAGVPSIV
jgi:hypothetical protein